MPRRLDLPSVPTRDPPGAESAPATASQAQSEPSLAELLERERQARREAEADRDRLWELLMQAPASIALFRGPQHVYVLSNPRNDEGIGRRMLLGKPIREAAPEAEPLGFVALLDRVYATGEPFSAQEMPVKLAGLDGQPREHFVNFVYQPTRDAQGAVDGVATFGFEVTDTVRARQKAELLATELQRNDERYRVFVGKSTEGIFRADAVRPFPIDLPEDEQIDRMFRDSLVAECNDAMARMYGFDTAEELLGVRMDKLLVREDPRNTEYLRTFIQNGYRIENAESREVARDGTAKIFINNLVGIVEGGLLLGAWGTQRDVTEQRHAEEENARLYREAQDAIRLRDEFLSIASHELKTPLTPLSLKLQMLASEARRQPESPFRRAVEDYIAVGSRQVKKLSELVNDLLDVARIAGGRLRLELEEVELGALVREVVTRYEPEAARAGSRLMLEEVPETVTGHWDRLRLEQVITNLVDNAIKYGSGKPIRVSLDSDASRARLHVKDEGIGIAPEHLSRIFERFERAVSERHYGGLGLGLYITRTIVEALGGSIQAESTPGLGTTFTVVLPRAPAAHGSSVEPPGSGATPRDT